MDATEECDICGQEHSPETCPELNHTSRDIINTSRARATLPNQFIVMDTSDNTVDVVTLSDLSSKYHLGTFEANRTTKPVGGPDDFILQIRLKNSDSMVWLDTRDENKCNWLCLIAVALTAEEKNVMALQVGLDIIYMTTREIQTGESLKVWYAPSYAKKINKPVQPDGLTKSMLNTFTKEILSKNDESGPPYSYIELSSSNVEMTHHPNRTRTEEKFQPKPRAATQCGKGIYVCAHPGCALIFPTQLRLDEHSMTHKTSADITAEMESLMADLKSETSDIISSTGDVLEDINVSKTSWHVLQDLPSSTASAIDSIINPRALRIRHPEGSGHQKCHHCDGLFNSVEELALHIKEHICQGGHGQKKCFGRRRKHLVSDISNSDSELISMDQPRKSRRPRNSRFVQDPNFVYGHTSKRKHEEMADMEKAMGAAGTRSTRDDKTLTTEKPVIKRKRGRPPKCKRANTSAVSDKKNMDIIEITDDKCRTGQLIYDQVDMTDKATKDNIGTEQTLCEKADIADEFFTQSEQVLQNGCIQSIGLGQSENMVKNEEDDVTSDITLQASSHKVVVKRETANANQDVMFEQTIAERLCQAEENDGWQQKNNGHSRRVLVINDQHLNAERFDVVCVTMAADVEGQSALGIEAHASSEGQFPDCKVQHGEGHEGIRNVGELSSESQSKAHEESFAITMDTRNTELNQTAEEVRELWNSGCLPCNSPMEDTNDSVECKQENVLFRSDHGNYSLKTIDNVSILKKPTTDADSAAVATTADNLFTTPSLVPSIVNLDDMDVITGESLSFEMRQGCPEGNMKLSEGKAIINENKTHYMCIACQTERPLVSIKELEDHLYTHIGISKCSECEELFVKVEEHKCKENAKNSAMVSQPVSDTDVKQGAVALECHEVKKETFRCSICKRLFDKEAHLTVHMKRHNSSASCQKCNRMFTSNEQLQKHDCRMSDSHNNDCSQTDNEKAHFCEFCGASYKKRQYLLLHMATHTKEHKCEKCGVHFARKETLMKHWTKCMPEEVAKKDVFSCKQCSRVFSKELSLQNHVLTVHTDSFKCDKCQKVFSSMFSMKRHACMEQTVGRFECSICPKVFRRKLYLKRHMAMHSGKFTCILCQQHYARKEELLNHMLECSASIQFETTGTIKCTVCDKVYTDVHAYRIHYQDHTHPYKCEVCNKPFLRPVALEMHKKKCKPYDGEPIICSICNKKFRSQIFLLRHKQVHDEKKYSCKQCNRKFRRIDYLNNHMCIDSEGRQIPSSQHYKKEELVTKDVCICPHCGKTFQTTSNLNKHILLHGEKKEVCEVCGKKFHLKVGLREHMKYVHTDEYLIECKVCKKRLKSRNSLYGHMSVYHSDIDTVYPCEECGKTFRQKGNLKKHMLVHSEKRSFSCKKCDKKFKFPEQLRRHELWHATGPRFFCDLCDKSFVMEFEIKKHLNTIHGGLTYICCYCKTDCHHFYSMKRHLQRRHIDQPEWQVSVNEFIRGLAVQTVTVITGDGKVGNLKKQAESQIGSNVKKLFRCGFCKQIFQLQQELQSHLTENHCKPHLYHCTYCAHTCTEQQAMHKHLQSEHADVEEWQNDPDMYVKHLQDVGGHLTENKFVPESRSLLQDLNILKEEGDVDGINPFSMTTETLDSPGILAQTMVSTATDLLGNVHQTLPQIDSQVLSLPLQGTEVMNDITDISLDLGQEPVIVAEVKDFHAKKANSSQTIIIKGENQDIELSGLLPQEVAEALQSLSIHGGFTGEQQTLITIAEGTDSIQGIPVTLSSDNNDQGLIILPVMEELPQEVQLTELQHNLKPHLDDISNEGLHQEASDNIKCDL